MSMNTLNNRTMGVAAKAQNGMRTMLGMLAVALVVACNYGGAHSTPHAPVNPAMVGAPSESDHTNTDAADQAGGYGTGKGGASVKDDNVDRSKEAALPVAPAAKDTTAAHGK